MYIYIYLFHRTGLGSRSSMDSHHFATSIGQLKPAKAQHRNAPLALRIGAAVLASPFLAAEKGSPGGWENDDLADFMAIPKDMKHHFATIIVGFDFIFKPFWGVTIRYCTSIYYIWVNVLTHQISEFKAPRSSWNSKRHQILQIFGGTKFKGHLSWLIWEIQCLPTLLLLPGFSYNRQNPRCIRACGNWQVLGRNGFREIQWLLAQWIGLGLDAPSQSTEIGGL